MLTEPCPYCAGSAVIKSSSTICYEILSEVKKISGDLDGQSLVLRVNPDIARALRDEERAVFKDLKQSLGREITLKTAVDRHIVPDRNVLGLIEGSDPKLKDEWVLVTAHFDHDCTRGASSDSSAPPLRHSCS